MKHLWLLLFVFLNIAVAKAQNNAYFGHYMFNPSYFNPGWGGGQTEGFIAFQHKSQWLGYETSFDGSGGAPTTQMLTALIPVKRFPISSFGLNVVNDNLGPVRNFQVALPITYTFHLRRSVLSLGVAPALFSQRLQGGDYRANDPNDEAIPFGSQSQFNPNLSAGLFFRSDGGFFIGIGLENILQPSFDFGLENLENKQAISYNLHVGHVQKISDKFSISPTMILRSDLDNFTFDVGVIGTFNEKMWAGLSFRKSESAIMYLGYSLLQKNQLKLGYSIDFVFVDQEAKSATTHEIFVRYDLPDLVFGGRKKIKTPRFSF